MDEKSTLHSHFIQTITHTIHEFHMLDQKGKVLVAVSGGPDSVALALAMMGVRKTYDITIGIAHLNHLLRGEASNKDEAFVKTFAHKFNLPFYSEQNNVRAYAKKHRLSIETAGREVRYDFFARLSNHHGYEKVATGHTADDTAELVLMNLLRGAGSKGLSGIPPVRGDRIIRPLIKVSKKQIIDFLAQQNQAYRVDESNTDPTYLRNRIRNQLIPHLQSEYNPEITDALGRMSHIMRQEEDLLNAETKKQYNRCRTKPESDVSIVFSNNRLSALHPAILNRVIRMAVKHLKKDLNRISFTHIKDIIDLCFHQPSGKSLDMPGQIRIYKRKGHLILKKEECPLRDIGRKEKQSRRKAQRNQGG